MGNFTYSTYVVQFGIVFYRTAATTKPLFVSDFVLVTLMHYTFNRIVILTVLDDVIFARRNSFYIVWIFDAHFGWNARASTTKNLHTAN